MKEPALTRRSTLVLLITLFLVGALGVAMYLVGQPQEIREKAAGGVALNFLPNEAQVLPSDPFTLQVVVDTGTTNYQVVGVNMDLQFDPAFVRVNTLSLPANPVLNSMPEYLIRIDNTAGTVHAEFIGGPTSTITGIAPLVLVNFTPLQLGTTTVHVVNTSIAAAVGQDENVLTEWGYAQVIVAGIVASPPPSVTPMPSPSVTPTPLPTPTPTPGSSPQPSPTVYPSASPQVSPSTNASASTNTCQNNQAGIPSGVTATAISTTQIRLSWSSASNATHYGIVYGPASHYYTWGAANIGNVTSYIVGGLSASTNYYFVVFAANGCGASAYSQEVSARTQSPTGGTSVIIPTPAGTTTVNYPTPSPVVVATPDPNFVPVDPNATQEEVIPFLAAKLNPSPSVEIAPTVSLPPDYGEQAAEKPLFTNELLTKIGGLFLIIVGLFVGIFFLRMKHS